MYRELLTKRAFLKRANDGFRYYDPMGNGSQDVNLSEDLNEALSAAQEGLQPAPSADDQQQAQTDKYGEEDASAKITNTIAGIQPHPGVPLDMNSAEADAAEQLANDESLTLDQRKFWANHARSLRQSKLLNFLSDKNNYGALAALGAAGLGGLGGAAFGGNADERILNAITGAAGGAGAVGGARGAMELLEGNVNPLLAAGLGGVTGGIGSGALARLLAKTLMK